MKQHLSIIIPAYNEENCINNTIDLLITNLNKEEIHFDILVVNDHSTDKTSILLNQLSSQYKELKYIDNHKDKGFGMTVRVGFESVGGDFIAIYMADGSDSPEDLINYYYKMQEGYDCVFGSRFIKGGDTINYPKFKLIINRTANLFIRVLFGTKYNDYTNAFKMYRRSTIEGLKPFLSKHFNLTVELPLKAISRGYSYTVVPNSWKNRSSGTSNLILKEMGSRYLFIIFYCLIEKWLCAEDYKKI